MIKLSDIEKAFKTLKYKPSIISVDNDYVTIRIDTGWLIISKEKYEKIFSEIHHKKS